jgi:hypothetical protein
MAETTYDSASLAVNKEDLNETIAFLAENRSPMYGKFAKTKATGTNHEWVEDKLRDSAVNSQPENKTFEFTGTFTDVRRSNYTQIMDAEYSVSDTELAVDKVGSKNRLARRLENAMKELARDAEKAASGSQTKAQGDKTTARAFDSFLTQVATPNRKTGSAAITETDLTDLIELVWKNAQADCAFVAGDVKRAITSFSLSSGRNTEIKNGDLPAKVSVYESDFGEIELHIDPEMEAGSIYVTKKDMNEWAFLRPFHIVPNLAKASDGTNGVVLGELTTVLRNSYASAVGTGFTGSAS